MANDEAVFSLYRYWLQANQMRDYLDRQIATQGVATYDSDRWTSQFIDMSLWYACLFVVVEGWEKLRLSDPEIDELLTSDHKVVLKRFRNAVFHAQSDYMSKKFVDFMRVGPESALWIRSLNRELGRFFLAWSQAQRQ